MKKHPMIFTIKVPKGNTPTEKNLEDTDDNQ